MTKSKESKEKYTAEYWSSELERSKDERSDFYDNAEKSIKVYKGDHKLPDCDRKINIWWSLCQTLLPAYYSRPPKVESDLRKKSGGDLARISAVAAERATQYVLDEENDMNNVGLEAMLGFQLTGEAVLCTRYEAELGEKEYTYSDDDGNEITEMVEAKNSERAIIEPIHFRDFLTSCARNKDEIEWQTRRAYLSKEQAKAKFGSDLANDLSFDALPEDIRRGGKHRDKNLYEGKAEFWEIWCEITNKVYWLHEGKKRILESGDPPQKFKGFFPFSRIVQNFEPSSVIPIGDYCLAEDLIIEVERLTTRIHATLQAVRTNAAYDATMGNEVEGILSGDLKMIPVKNWPSYRTRGGLTSGIEFAPVEMYIRALEALVQARNEALQKLYEITAASDLIRGSTSPVETATAQQLKSNYNNLRFRLRTLSVYDFFNDAVEKLAETVCEQYSAEKLYEICNGEELVQELPDPPPPMGPNGQPMPAQPMPPEMKWEQVVGLLRDDPRRRYKIEIATDSIVALDERADREERTDLLASAGGFLGQMQPMVEKFPSLMPMAMKMLEFAIRSYRAGKEMEGVFKSTLGAIGQQIQQQQQQPPPPDPVTVDSETRLQIARIQSQTDLQKAQISMQESAQKAQMEQVKLEIETTLEQQRAAMELERTKLDMQKHQLESALRVQEIQLKAQEIQATVDQKSVDSILDARSSEFKALVDQQKVEMEKYKIQLETYEKLIEEKRLSMEKTQVNGTGKEKLPPINIQVDASKPGKRRGRITRDELGNAMLEMEDM